MELQNALVVFDLETTGTWIEKDKIVEIAMIKVLSSGERETYDKRVNPGMPIPPLVSELIGIKNEDVACAPSFRDISKEVFEFIGDSDIGGFNVERFDLPLLSREFNEAGISFKWNDRVVIDSQKVYHLNEKRDLTAAYKFYCDKPLDNAHSALADTQATLEILESQIKRYGEGENTLEPLKSFEYKVLADFYDDERKFRWWNGKLYMMFGKYARRLSLQDVVRKDRGYLEWILGANFSEEIKSLVEDALNGKFPSQVG